MHGREAYRRNAYLISYMFYKNVLLVIPIFMFGFLSKFSSVLIYSSALYSLYNVVFTAIPIIWFAVFDFEHSKSHFLKTPSLYRIGLEDIFFDKSTFWRWFGYAVWQGALLMFLFYYTLNGWNDGQLAIGEVLTDGNFVFVAVVVIANVKILVSTNEYTFWACFWVLISIFSVLPLYALLSAVPSSPDLGQFSHLFQSAQAYLSLLFASVCLIMVDVGMERANAEVRQWVINRNKEVRKRRMMEALKDSTVIRRRVTEYKNTGYAFSGEKGHDVLLMDSLGGRLQEAMRRQLFGTGVMGQISQLKKEQSYGINAVIEEE